ncbi:MAG: HmuY family protein [Dysgonamonadaceae bacterium]|jgi:hypothetical protein|nr:HmuY family protein [Dysgonamonadaceae bacterium]
MKKVFFYLTATLFTASVFTSCSKDEEDPQPGETKEVYVNASSSTAWHYYSFANEAIVGSADESAENNAAWAARKDWDIAIRRYNIRTNSGEFTSAAAKGGVYTSDASTTFASVLNVPDNAVFATDKAVTSSGMGGTTTIVRSDAQVIQFKQNEDGSLVMPPVYLQAPVYVFRTAGGDKYYKVQFTQYQDENSTTGHVKFNVASIPR